MSKQPAVVVRDLTVAIGEKILLDKVTFEARRGEITGLIGPNGAGKSTLLAAISGDLERSSGTIDILGHDPATSSPKSLARIRAVMMQDVSVSFEFLVRDVVAMGRRPWEGTEKQLFERPLIDAALAATDAAHLAGRDVITLSGGERARVALSRVLAQQTPVVMLDEPTAALDIRHQEQVLGLMRTIARETDVAVIVVLHDLNAAAAYCNRIVCLANGSVAQEGNVDSVYTDENLSTVYGWPIHVEKREDDSLFVHPARDQGGKQEADFVALANQAAAATT
ncbi:Hemin import ATP-binding protein HmuV [Corynebacterium pseudotuberculosis]|uniref:heme ABC transporter ATP-binding protein n=1 Tax=Corynebacterium pseudotuberculosis TaxID=1719 RepID=UPI0007DB1283|nr:heme ABC transporter ATP-binding protein [Corynebacterium pseudotuberculosis]ANH23231.1 Hemin import ATP-binding protein HmuV [Corynebacterium pseudotuberculosis]